jgi:hypothetical protein
MELFILSTYFLSFEFFINFQIAFLSSFFVIMGSMYAYKKMVSKEIETNGINTQDQERDLLEKIEDPHELYVQNTEIEQIPIEDLDFKEIVKEEKKKIKTFSFNSMKRGSKGSVSAFRIVPYIFLVLGFIALKNNEMLDISVYLGALFVGIVLGYISAKNIFALRL